MLISLLPFSVFRLELSLGCLQNLYESIENLNDKQGLSVESQCTHQWWWSPSYIAKRRILFLVCKFKSNLGWHRGNVKGCMFALPRPLNKKPKTVKVLGLQFFAEIVEAFDVVRGIRQFITFVICPRLLRCCFIFDVGLILLFIVPPVISNST